MVYRYFIYIFRHQYVQTLNFMWVHKYQIRVCLCVLENSFLSFFLPSCFPCPVCYFNHVQSYSRSRCIECDFFLLGSQLLWLLKITVDMWASKWVSERKMNFIHVHNRKIMKLLNLSYFILVRSLFHLGTLL